MTAGWQRLATAHSGDGLNEGLNDGHDTTVAEYRMALFASWWRCRA